jgi:hypothetical protein
MAPGAGPDHVCDGDETVGRRGDARRACTETRTHAWMETNGDPRPATWWDADDVKVRDRHP